jgi:hypothetical protein
MLVPSGGVLVAVSFITMHNGKSRLDISSCVTMEDVDCALDCVCDVWDGEVVVWEQLVARIFLA